MNLDVAKNRKTIISLNPAQFGMRHRGKNIMQAEERFAKNEFALDICSIGCMALTHVGRFTNAIELCEANTIQPPLRSRQTSKNFSRLSSFEHSVVVFMFDGISFFIFLSSLFL